MNATQMQLEPHDPVVLVKYEHRSAGGSWEEPVSAVRGTPLRRSQRLNSTLDGRTTGQLGKTLSRARELCERWRSGHHGGGVATGQHSAATVYAAHEFIRPQQLNSSNTLPPTPTDEDGGGKLSRWFSVRRGSHHHYDIGANNTDKMPKLAEMEEDLLCAREAIRWRAPAPALPPEPPGLSPQQQRRRHVVEALIHSENSYVNTLHRLLNDYRRPLEESSPCILNASKVATLFHRLPDILQCHLQFRGALAAAAVTWDRDEKIGDVFLTAFSKAVILDVYSDFINNFSVAMELAKMESKRKSALADFFKVKQISAHDRLSFFGLMVKPVQRFPQFIMFLQDLLKYTPSSHSDRLALQRALTRLEALTDALNERKREAERTQAFREAMRRLGGRAAAAGAGSAPRFGAARLLAARADRRHLLRQDDVEQLEFNQWGGISKCKTRRVLLMNDLLVCVSVAGRDGDQERLSLKWAHPVADLEILDAAHHSAPTLSRMLAHVNQKNALRCLCGDTGFNRSGSVRSSGSAAVASGGAAAGGDALCGEMASLMHDYEVVSRLADLAAGLDGTYAEFAPDVFRKVLRQIQQGIQRRDDEVAWSDGCCLLVGVRGREEPLTLRARSAGARAALTRHLRLALTAAAPANRPAWRPPSALPHNKSPLFVAAQPLHSSGGLSEVSCGCVYTITSGVSRRIRCLVWLCIRDQSNTRVVIAHHRQAKLKQLLAIELEDTQVRTAEYVPPSRKSTSVGEVWLGTGDNRILCYPAAEPERRVDPFEIFTPAPVVCICSHRNCVFAALESGTVLIYSRLDESTWKEPHKIQLGDKPVRSLLPLDRCVYASCGLRIVAIDTATLELGKEFNAAVADDEDCQKYVEFTAHSGAGLWIALNKSTYVSLYHAETLEHLQDVDFAADVAKTIGAREGSRPSHVSALLACEGLLWIGTTAGVSVAVPLPRLEGLPLVGHSAVSQHAHAGPVTCLLSLANDSRDVHSIRRTSRMQSLVDTPECDVDRSFESEVERPKLERCQSDEASPSRPARANVSITRRRRPVPDTRMSRTLARCANLGARDVYGLYGDLMFVKDCSDVAGEADVHGSGGDALRKSDPELATIPFRVSTLDRRLKMRAGRPRSLDLSNWSVESRSSSLCTSSGSEESMALRGLSRAGSAASRQAEGSPSAAASPGADERCVSRSDSAASKVSSSGVESGVSSSSSGASAGRSVFPRDEDEARVSCVTLMCGRGYVDWRQLAEAAERPPPSADPNPRDASVIVWETRL